MPQIGWFEILIIVILAILIIGPKDFPLVLKKIGSWVGAFKNYFIAAQNTITDVEKSTLFYISENYNSTNKAIDYLTGYFN